MGLTEMPIQVLFDQKIIASLILRGQRSRNMGGQLVNDASWIAGDGLSRFSSEQLQ